MVIYFILHLNINRYKYIGDSVVKNLHTSEGDMGSIPGSGRSPGEGNDHPLQNYCLENSMDRGAWQAAVHGVTKSWTQLSNYIFTFLFAQTENFCLYFYFALKALVSA